ncbi:MAG TPA: winged helix-turn-helix domain-containing protein [Candidatus Binatia bacterium]|nr:winged helix-turn-helix domain-containing protein [Candidatus Binatia bacterium]
MIDDWIEQVEAEVMACLRDAPTMSPRELAARLGTSESTAISYICLLASEGRLTIERVSAPKRAVPGKHAEADLAA